MSLTSNACHAVSSQARRIGRVLALSSLAIYLATTGGSMATDPMSYEVAKSLFESRSTAMSYNVFGMEAHRGIDGRYYSPYGLGHPLYSLPFYALGRLAEQRLGPIGRPDTIRKAAFVLGSAVATALVVWIVFLFGFRLTGNAAAASWTAVAVGFGSLLWPYSKFGFNAPVATLAVTAGVYACWAGVRTDTRRLIMLGGLALGGALLVRHELGLVGLVVAVWAAHEYRWSRRQVVRVGLLIAMPVAIATSASFYYNLVRFGTPWDTGYLRDTNQTFGTPLAGVFGLLLSPGRSFFLYSLIAVPGVVALVRLFSKDRSTAWLLTAVAAALFVFYTSLTWWDADRSYGPRYLLPLIPLVCVPLSCAFADRTRTARRRLTAVLLVSVILQLPGVLFDFSKVGPALGVRHPLEERRWNWRVASITLNTRAIVTFLPDNIRYLAGAARPPEVSPGLEQKTGYAEQFGYSFDFWWLYLFYLGKWPAGVALLAGASLLTAGAAGLWRVRRLAQEPGQV